MILFTIKCVLLIAVTLVTAQEGLQLSLQDNLQTIDAIEPPVLRTANDVTYHFFSRRHPSNSIAIKLSTVSSLGLTDFVGSKDTLFIIHGWRSSNDSSINHKIREMILSQNDLNVFVVDWSPIAGQSYSNAQGAVVRVGEYVAGFVRALKAQHGLNINKVKFVGHSLGAHVAGNAGAALGGIVDRIVGLDPAGPGFSSANVGNRLDKSDAKMVSVIHTNGGLLGFGESMGHADYWPNGGKSQAGCGLDLVGSCAHSRAYYYYAESLSSGVRFLSTKCSSYSDFNGGKCSFNDLSFMGGFVSDYGASGDYYLTTNSKAPFAKGT